VPLRRDALEREELEHVGEPLARRLTGETERDPPIAGADDIARLELVRARDGRALGTALRDVEIARVDFEIAASMANAYVLDHGRPKTDVLHDEKGAVVVDHDRDVDVRLHGLALD